MSATTRPPYLPGNAAAVVAVYRLSLRLLASRARVIWLTALGLGAVLLGWAVGSGTEAVDRAENGFDFLAIFGLAMLVPFVSLVFGTACLGDLRDDRTLVYVWLGPLRRLPIAAGAAAASLTLVAPLTIAPLIVAAGLAGGGELMGAAAASAALGVVAYTGLFTLLGLWVRRSLVWGLAYILIWEGFIAEGGAGVARLALRSYTRTVAANMVDVDPDVPVELSTAAGVAIPILVGMAGVLITGRRLDRMEID